MTIQHDRPLGSIARLWRYPIKALAAESLDAVDCDARGLAGDRARALFVESSGHARTGKPYRGKEDDLLHTVASPNDAIALAARRHVALAPHDDGPYFDLDPVSLLVDTWLHDGERLVGRTLEPLRYRPNLYVTAAADFTADEADLVDRVLAIGNVRVRVSQPIRRCVTTTYDLRTGESDPRVLAAIATQRANTMGIYAHVVRAGRIRCGDTVAFAR
ncbi:MAG: hypothetical protein NVSMB59_01030 [Vulcanimicrobiaceae bacterium]